jgi:hypothetical protein
MRKPSFSAVAGKPGPPFTIEEFQLILRERSFVWSLVEVGHAKDFLNEQLLRQES